MPSTITIPPRLMTWLQLYCSANGLSIDAVATDAIALHLDDVGGELLADLDDALDLTDEGRHALAQAGVRDAMGEAT